MADRNIPGVEARGKVAGLGSLDYTQRADPGGRQDISDATHAGAVNALRTTFGGNIRIDQRMPVSLAMADLNRVGTRGHASTGIPYAISGTAEVVEIDVGERLMAFSDPIRAILGTGVHTSQKIIIKRQFASGGGASVVPERAPARTIGLQEDVREVVLTRYGADIEWNLNLLARPADFQKEMQIKLNAQKESLQMELVRMSYDMLMTEGTSLVNALVASSPVFSANPGMAQINAERIYVSSVFGAMQRFPYPVHNLLAAAKYATNFTISQAEKTVLIVPFGLPELHKYTKQENMVSYIHGVQHGDPLTAEVTGGAVDTTTNTTVYVHRPPMSYVHGAAAPQSDGPLLATEVKFATFYVKTDDDSVYNHLTRSLEPMRGTANEIVIRVYTAVMHSAILGIPNGADQQTGEMLVGYPSTMVGTDVSTETGRMRLRMYLGSVLYRPENVMILPDVAWGGLKDVKEYIVKNTAIGTRSSFVIGPQAGTGDAIEPSMFPPGSSTRIGGAFESGGSLDGSETDATNTLNDLNGFTVYQAATFGKDTKPKLINNGHLGCLDSPECGDRVFGNQVYTCTPSAVNC
ncbi:MAG: hypothetical protein ACPGR8_01230 [Limisphaerales bacterium]